MKIRKMKLSKRLFSLLLIIFLCIENFAAIVSDNDGSAFVTKAEFEAIKRDFADQVMNYQDSVDAKIDGAIANYLAGIKVAKQIHVRLISDIETVVGKGYRNWKSDDLISHANRLTTEWIMGNSSAVCFRGAGTTSSPGGWKDISTGELNGVYSDSGMTGQSVSAANSPWWIPQWERSGGVVKLTDGHHAVPPTGIWTFSGQAINKSASKPFLYVDRQGKIQEFSNTRPLVIDMRSARGNVGATAHNRWFYYAGVASGTRPAQKICNINTLINDLPIKCFNDQDTAGADGFGNIYIVKKSSTFSVNPNVFCWNPTGLCTAYDADCEQALVWGQSGAVKLAQYYDISSSMKRLVWGGSASGAGNAALDNMVVPYISFMPNEANTALPADAFETVSGYDYKRMKQKYLQVKDFKSVADTSRNLYVYEGLPIYTAERDAELSFDINITASKYSTSDTNPVVLWDDHGSDTMKIRIKNKPFVLNDDYSECIKVRVGTVESEEGSIPANKLTKVSFDVEKGKTYYMQWYCNGSSYGGEIIYLGNGIEKIID